MAFLEPGFLQIHFTDGETEPRVKLGTWPSSEDEMP